MSKLEKKKKNVTQISDTTVILLKVVIENVSLLDNIILWFHLQWDPQPVDFKYKMKK